MNTREKGRRKEKQVRDILVAQGYDVQMAPMPTKWAKENDMFGGSEEERIGLWDLVAVGPYDIRFIQVKTNLSDVKKKWREKAKAWQCPPEARKELWVVGDRKAVRIIPIT